MATNIEPLLQEDNSRFVLFPIKYNKIWKMYKKAQASFWTADEISFKQSDLDEWEKLDTNSKFFLERQLAFFAGSDGIVMENLASRFCREVAIPEAKNFYAFQLAMESVHSETYSLIIDTYIKDEKKKAHLFNAIDEIKCIKDKADWALKWIDNPQIDFSIRLIGFAIVEGVFFSGAFASIYYVKEKGILEALTFSNELISRDESLHTEFAILLFSYVVNKPSEVVVHDIFKDAVAIEIEFITQAIPCNLLGMNSDLMTEYIKFTADRLLVQLGYSQIWNISKCPLDFMDRISLDNKSNFFDVRVSDYSKASINNEKSELVFGDSDDF
jgi:ribonucleotide reductase beta subunit family protein with ferritin-like domain